MTGPLLRAAGEPWDLRKAFDYLAYPEMDFKIPVGTVGDNYDRYRVRVAEMVESARIIEQALDALPEGPFIADDRKYVLPPRSELSTSMESLIHHFKLVTEGYRVDARRGLLRDRVPARGARLLRPRRRLLEAGPGPLPRPLLRQPAGLQGHGDRQLRRRHDLQPRHARPDPRRGRPMSPVDGAGVSNPNLPVDRAVTEGRVPDRTPGGDPGAARSRLPGGAARADRDADGAATRTANRPRSRRSGRCSERYGWCTPEGIRQAAAVMRVTPAYLESVASFYDLLHTEPVGTHQIAVCTNISCWMRGGDELLDAFRAAAEGDEDLFVTGFECLGACDIAPMASIDERYFGPLEAAEAATAIDQLLAGDEVLPEKALAKRPLAGDTGRRRPMPHALRPASCSSTPRTRRCARSTATRATAATRRWRRPTARWRQDEVLKELEDSGLRGRGGAGFSMGKKASFLPRGEMAKYLCCNADESEPGAFKDRELMQRNPHQLIEGIAIAALAADAGHAFIFIRGEYDSQADILDAAVAEAYEAGYLGKDILGTPPRPRAGRPPRRRRLHLRRGDGAARRARGQARQPAPEAAVPGGAGPLRRADADQQRRDALQRAADRRQRRRVVQGLRHRAVAGDQGRLDLRRRAPARQLRGRAGDPDPRADLRPRRRPARGPRGQGLLPRRLLLAGAHRRGGRSTSPTASRRWPRRARCSAPARSSSPTTASRSRTWRCARRASTTTSPAASAPPAARAPTGR